MENSTRTHRIAAAARVFDGTIVELVYDAVRQSTAFVAAQDGQWQIVPEVAMPNEDVLVPYMAGNNLIRHGCVLLPSMPVDHGGKAMLLRDIETFLHRYVDLSPQFERLAAHYALLSWVFDAFNELPYLRFQGDYGSGKSRALMALGSIVYRGIFASGASTVSPIFHTLDALGGTLILDEADLRFSDKTADMVKILNNGTVKGLPVLRTLQNRHKEFNPAAFAVFGPKIVAMRASFGDQALESRFLSEQMGTRPLRHDIPIQLPDSLRQEALALRNRLLHFRLTNLFSVRIDPTRAIAGIDPRLNQMALPLLALMDDASVRREFAEFLRIRHAALRAQRREQPDRRVLEVLERLLGESEAPFILLKDIVRAVNADATLEFLSARAIGRLLRLRGVPLRKRHGEISVFGDDWQNRGKLQRRKDDADVS